MFQVVVFVCCIPICILSVYAYAGSDHGSANQTLWNELPTNLREPHQIQSPSLSPFTYHLSHMADYHLHHPYYHHLHLLLLVQYFILNSRLGSSANPFLYTPFPFLSDWFYWLSDPLMYLFCSTAGCVCMVCRLSGLLVGFRTHFTSMHFHLFNSQKYRPQAQSLFGRWLLSCPQLLSSFQRPLNPFVF